MICKDFEQRWNELLDAEAAVDRAPGSGKNRPAGVPSIDEAEALLMAHAADCPTCRPIAVRYQTLRHAIRAWCQAPTPSADLVHRVLSVPDESNPGTLAFAAGQARSYWRIHRGYLSLVSALAASVLVCVALGILVNQRRSLAPLQMATKDGTPDLHPSPTPRQIPAGPPTLDRALAEATSATWDLALSASEPAARISRGVLDSGGRTDGSGVERSVSSSMTAASDADERLAGLSLSVPLFDGLGSEATSPTAVLQQVGDQFSAGVRPLSTSAQSAFGFLLGSPPARAGSRPGGSAPSGA